MRSSGQRPTSSSARTGDRAAELGRAKAQQRKAAVVVGVDELVVEGATVARIPSHPYGYSRT